MKCRQEENLVRQLKKVRDESMSAAKESREAASKVREESKAVKEVKDKALL